MHGVHARVKRNEVPLHSLTALAVKRIPPYLLTRHEFVSLFWRKRRDCNPVKYLIPVKRALSIYTLANGFNRRQLICQTYLHYIARTSTKFWESYFLSNEHTIGTTGIALEKPASNSNPQQHSNHRFAKRPTHSLHNPNQITSLLNTKARSPADQNKSNTHPKPTPPQNKISPTPTIQTPLHHLTPKQTTRTNHKQTKNINTPQSQTLTLKTKPPPTPNNSNTTHPSLPTTHPNTNKYKAKPKATQKTKPLTQADHPPTPHQQTSTPTIHPQPSTLAPNLTPSHKQTKTPKTKTQSHTKNKNHIHSHNSNTAPPLTPANTENKPREPITNKPKI